LELEVEADDDELRLVVDAVEEVVEEVWFDDSKTAAPAATTMRATIIMAATILETALFLWRTPSKKSFFFRVRLYIISLCRELVRKTSL
jgi:hypothetical protein